jgi:hypothetical protein
MDDELRPEYDLGQLLARADFGSERGRGRRSVGRIGRKSGSFGLWDSPKR